MMSMMVFSNMELPPRARRILIPARGHGRNRGTTSACAENTGQTARRSSPAGNYLRVRGEYCMMSMMVFSNMELPPRARRIPDIAGNRESSFVNYLRVRGEYSPGKTSTPGFVELPPRARRIPFDGMECANLRGTTSACAENTVSASVSSGFTWNYLRVRGEYTMRSKIVHYSSELPPRARRIHTIRAYSPQLGGTTSACAENTTMERIAPSLDRNYLRVRGEYLITRNASPARKELPPRARRIPGRSRRHRRACGTTSACAENTSAKRLSIFLRRNYLRVRGEYRNALSSQCSHRELPPRARRIRLEGRPETLIFWNYLRVRGEYQT